MEQYIDIYIEIESLDWEEIEVSVIGTFHIENDSIGQYEYWGEVCYDNQPDYLEFDEIEPIITKDNEQYKTIINKYIDDNFEEISIQIEENYISDNQPDY